MSKNLKLFLKLSVVFLLSVTAIMAIVIVVLIVQLPVGRMVDVSRPETVIKENPERIEMLEAGSAVDMNELKTYLAFSGYDFAVNRWLSTNSEKGFVSKWGEDRILIKENIKLDSLRVNECQDLYCYQHRIPFDNMNPSLWKGLIGIEDYRYLDHFGLDAISLFRALVADIKAMSMVQGGSTLTQQLVKNLFLTNRKDFTRKFVELVYSVYLEARFSKEEILEAYFNEVWWGVVGGVRVKGVFAASASYFDKKLHDLDPYEVAILVSLLKGPSYYHPVNHTDRLKTRVATVYQKLVELKMFPNRKSDVWNDKEWNNWVSLLKIKNRYKFPRNIWCAMKQDPGYLSRFESYVFHGAAERVLEQISSKVGDRDVSVKATLRNYLKNDSVYNYYSKFERDAIGAINEEKHQVGSVLKPILYREFVSLGKNFSDMVSMDELTLQLKSGDWTPRDHDKGDIKEITLLEALKKSYNKPVIRIARELGFGELEKKLMPIIPEFKTPISEFPAQLLGAIELSLNRVEELYVSFIDRECKVSWDASIINLLSNPSETTISGVVSKELQEMRFFGKTGTTNNSFDNWYVFFDGTTIGTIWTGLDGVRDGKSLEISGSWAAFRIFQYFSLNRGRRFNELICPSTDLEVVAMPQ